MPLIQAGDLEAFQGCIFWSLLARPSVGQIRFGFWSPGSDARAGFYPPTPTVCLAHAEHSGFLPPTPSAPQAGRIPLPAGRQTLAGSHRGMAAQRARISALACKVDKEVGRLGRAHLLV